jgi:lipopolysaccharide export system protein LptC
MINHALFSAFLVLFVGGFLLVWDSSPDSFMRNQSPQVDSTPRADSYMTEIISRQFSDTGKEKFILSAPKVELFSDTSETLLTEPELISFSHKAGLAKTKTVRINAKNGVLTGTGEILILTNNVVVTIETAEGKTQLNTERLVYVPSSETASTAAPFDLLSPQVKISGKGLEADFSNQKYTLKSEVQAVHEPI